MVRLPPLLARRLKLPTAPARRQRCSYGGLRRFTRAVNAVRSTKPLLLRLCCVRHLPLWDETLKVCVPGLRAPGPYNLSGYCRYDRTTDLDWPVFRRRCCALARQRWLSMDVPRPRDRSAVSGASMCPAERSVSARAARCGLSANAVLRRGVRGAPAANTAVSPG